MEDKVRKKVWVNYTTFARDLEWMRYSLESFRKYCSGFSGVTIVVPTWDVDKFLQFEKFSTPECPVLVKNFLEYPQKGFVHHLAMKCYADVFSPEADFIFHMDPDCLFSEPQTPDDYFVDGKPVLLIEPYSEVKKYHEPRHHWKGVTEMALKFDCQYETMCRHPAVHYRETYRALRDYMEGVHLTPFYDFVIKQKNSYPQNFGEFNTLGSFALEKAKDKYHFIDRGAGRDSKDPKPLIEQMWSYRGTGIYMDKIKEILK